MTSATQEVPWHLDRTFAASTGQVRWAVLGPEESEEPPVALLHGTPFSSHVWRSVARALAGRRRVHVWDMPGYGASEMRAGQDVSLAARAVVLTELLDHWGLTEPAVVAHDFGGCVALRAHLLHGARHARLALVDPVAMAPWESPAYRLLGRHADVFTQLPPALHRALVREYVASASATGLRPEVLERLTEPWCTAEGRAAFHRQIAANDQRMTDEVEGRYGEITLPTPVCRGARDTWVPPERGHALAARIAGARLRLIEGAGHLVQEDAPAELTAELAEFLAAGARPGA
ncbi:alpha/beta fold hydrolase [Streptomyces benahoarensis]|uniref:Alpha/beta hydrolase n=1 Tax=Streptomyces benahoarensis TaxID=2595054 RepID=A0A553ZM54_9ACTN|nr:alpha/beta hydrolase [Streptomyces benahoarensis]TSB24061.1 alpha/beta hydrolase [Streptomyces benahoarensis]TSB42465.1 alpha/beta hydrolase [Streptomyces benahoarensis]